MLYRSTRDEREIVDFRTAVIKGLAENKGLYIPVQIPSLPASFFAEIDKKSNVEIATEVMHPFVEENITQEELHYIMEETLNFEFPLVKVEEDRYAFELYHGPTKAFKDVGARFMSRCLAHFKSNEKSATTVLVATSGDTGAAVANGFYEVNGVDVAILFPKGKVSAYQEEQMTSLGKNIRAIEVDGNFDDCQALVKRAFSDKELRSKLELSSANSINVARFLPQMLYYFFMYKAMPKEKRSKIVVSVPSGNFGNLTAGLYAKRMGLPIHSFVAATNKNDTFVQYLEEGEYRPKPSVPTYSNAMDVGAPSNFERIKALYGESLEAIRADIKGRSVSDEETLEEIKRLYEEAAYIADPHGAVGMISLKELMPADSVGVFLETAHPCKFESVVKMAIPSFPDAPLLGKDSSKQSISNSYTELLQLIL